MVIESTSSANPSVSSDRYQTETYRGIEIRVRVRAESGDPERDEAHHWSGSYSFFTGMITHLPSDRVRQHLAERFGSREEAEEASLAAARLAVDREIQVRGITERNRQLNGRHHADFHDKIKTEIRVKKDRPWHAHRP
ncbi:MAG: hypothetical protein V4671_06020 [Armatimonadota bacterium]